MRYFLGFVLLFLIGGPWVGHSQELAGQETFLAGMLPFNRYEQGWRFNPTAFVLLDTLKNGNVGVNYRLFDNGSIHSLFEGTGGNRTVVSTYGYRVDPGKAIYSGAAAWETGVNRTVRWTNVRDALMLYPYLVADSLGGDYHYESYELEGSWAVYYKRGVYGLRGKYRGEVAYRLRDPRPKNTVSELRLNPGAMWLFDSWYAGTFFSYTFYRQHLDTKIETPNRKDRFFVLRGMGLYDLGFSVDESTFSRYYRQHEYDFGIQAGRNSGGLSGYICYSRRKMEVEEGDNRKPFLLKTNGVNAGLTWCGSDVNADYLLNMKGGFIRKKGVERSYEKIKSDTLTGAYVWRKLTEAEKIELKEQHIQIEVLVQHRISSRFIGWYGLNAGWKREEERYLMPAYSKVLADMTGMVRAGFARRYGNKRLEMEVSGGYKKNVTASLAAPGQQIVVDNMLLPEYAFRRLDHAIVALRGDFRFPVYKQTLLAVYSDFRGAWAQNSQNRWLAEAGVRVLF